MNWKLFLTAGLSGAIISFPQNIIGCGPGIDPYDYYTSFFNPAIGDNESLRPFYYTGYNSFYSENEAVQPIDELAKEWADYTRSGLAAAKQMLTGFSLKDLTAYYNSAEKNTAFTANAKLKANAAANYLHTSRDLEALGYLLYAKKTEPFTAGNEEYWQPVERDSMAMAKLMRNGIQLYNAAKKDLFKLRFGYQVIRLAHYSGNSADAVRYYEQLVQPLPAQGIVSDLAAGIKAGALWRTGRSEESVYLFSKLFGNSPVKKIPNYLSFKWAVDSGKSRDTYLALCKNAKERADMLALFAIGSTANEVGTLREIFRLDTSNSNLRTLLAREINKTEEFYLTPVLNGLAGGRAFYGYWNSEQGAKPDRANELLEACRVFAESDPSSAALYLTAAAYCEWMLRDDTAAKAFLAQAKKLPASEKIKDQTELVNLLIYINDPQKIDADKEAILLPSLEWLRKKAIADTVKISWNDASRWKLFYRNTMAEVLAKKYHAQGDIYRESMAIGAAEKMIGGNYNSLDFLRTKTDIRDVELLYSLFTSKQQTPFDQFLIRHNALKVADVADFAGTAYLRNGDYANAIKWFEKVPASGAYVVNKNPFIELLYDLEEGFNYEKPWSRLLFAKEMLRLQKSAIETPSFAAQQYFKMGLGLYNTTYYGHTWELVQYMRSGSDGYSIPKNATAFEKEYYGAFAAHDMFKKAMDASPDKNFKAKCLFMMAKCSQKTIGKPRWEDYPGNYEAMSADEKIFFAKFKDNKYFPELVREYKNTKFFEEAYGSCTYLSDFVYRNK